MLNHFNNTNKAPTLKFDLDFKLNEPNRRKGKRTPCLIPAHYKINRQIYSSFILDINETGAFIETDRPFTIGNKIVLRFIDPNSRRTSLINGSIAWSSDAAVGVKFNYHMFTPF